MLTREAWNALLKILEEPPPRVVFVFATTEAQKIANAAAPILSRLQRFDFRRIGPHAIVDRLKQVALAEQLAYRTPRCTPRKGANGWSSRALSLLDQSSPSAKVPSRPPACARSRLLPDELYGEACARRPRRRAMFRLAIACSKGCRLGDS